MDIAVEVYEISLLLPNDEKFNLIHQIKKCAVSIPSNIAEGSGRNHNKEFIQFLGIANGSTFELITQLILAKRLKLIKEDKHIIWAYDELQNIGKYTMESPEKLFGKDTQQHSLSFPWSNF